jgi:predicted Zn-dependent protease
MRSIEHLFDDGAVNGAEDGRGIRMTSPVRLTRRGRAVVVTMAMLVLVVAGFTLGRGSSQAAGPIVRHHVTVEAGETLWSVAARIAPHDDPRLVVADIESLNHLAGAEVEPGQLLLVPAIG